MKRLYSCKGSLDFSIRGVRAMLSRMLERYKYWVQALIQVCLRIYFPSSQSSSPTLNFQSTRLPPLKSSRVTSASSGTMDGLCGFMEERADVYPCFGLSDDCDGFNVSETGLMIRPSSFESRTSQRHTSTRG